MKNLLKHRIFYPSNVITIKLGGKYSTIYAILDDSKEQIRFIYNNIHGNLNIIQNINTQYIDIFYLTDAIKILRKEKLKEIL